MNNWVSVSNEALKNAGWYLWSRHDERNGNLYQITTNPALVPKSAAGFMDVDLLLKTRGITIH